MSGLHKFTESLALLCDNNAIESGAPTGKDIRVAGEKDPNKYRFSYEILDALTENSSYPIDDEVVAILEEKLTPDELDPLFRAVVGTDFAFLRSGVFETPVFILNKKPLQRYPSILSYFIVASQLRNRFRELLSDGEATKDEKFPIQQVSIDTKTDLEAILGFLPDQHPYRRELPLMVAELEKQEKTEFIEECIRAFRGGLDSALVSPAFVLENAQKREGDLCTYDLPSRFDLSHLLRHKKDHLDNGIAIASDRVIHALREQFGYFVIQAMERSIRSDKPSPITRSSSTKLPLSLRNHSADVSSLHSNDDLIGYEEIWQRNVLPQILRFLYPQAVSSQHSNLLLSGPPGTGKTAFAESVARFAMENGSGIQFFSLNIPDIFSKWVGESQRNMRELLDFLHANQPCIIFTDEVDGVFFEPGSMSVAHEETVRIQQAFMKEMSGFATEGRRIFFIAATNRSHAINPAFLRDGRFDIQVECPHPTANHLAKILMQKGDKRKDVIEISDRSLVKLFAPHDLHQTGDLASAFVGSDITGILKRIDDRRLISATHSELATSKPLHSQSITIDLLEEVLRDHLSFTAVRRRKAAEDQANIVMHTRHCPDSASHRHALSAVGHSGNAKSSALWLPDGWQNS